MSAAHTATPWEISFNGQDWDICAEHGGDMIADLAGLDNAQENAAFIFRACNAHDDLVTELDTADRIIGVLLAHIDYLSERDKGRCMQDLRSRGFDIEGKARRTALTKAGVQA